MKNDICILQEIVQKLKNGIKFKLAKWFLSYWSKHYFDCFDP